MSIIARQHISLWFNYFVTGFLLLSAVVYFSTPDIMSYHKSALGNEWLNVSQTTKLLFILAVKTSASGFLTAGVSGLFVLLKAKDQKWSAWFLLIVNSCLIVPMIISGIMISKYTGGSTPWPIAVFLQLLVITSFFLNPNEKQY